MATNRFPTRYALFTDQHGRKYGADMDPRTGHPCGPIDFKHRTPSGNLPPWLPAAKYLLFDTIEPGKVTVQYDDAIADAERAIGQWETLIVNFATGMYGDKAGPEIEKPGPTLRKVVGPRPAEPALIEAAKEGNKWALGFTDAMPKWAEPLMRIVGPVKVAPVKRSYPDAPEPKNSTSEAA